MCSPAKFSEQEMKNVKFAFIIVVFAFVELPNTLINPCTNLLLTHVLTKGSQYTIKTIFKIFNLLLKFNKQTVRFKTFLSF